MKEAFLITSYCDTEKKQQALISTINTLKKYDADICIHSHYWDVPTTIQKQVDYYLYSSNNPIFYDNLLAFWYLVMDKYRLSIHSYDYGYTVLKQYKEGLSYLFSVGYEKVHIINYDINVNDYLIEKLRSSDNVFFGVNDDRWVYTTHFSVTKEFSDKVMDNITEETYYNYSKSRIDMGILPVMEVYFYGEVERFKNKTMYKISDDEVYENIRELYDNEIGATDRAGVKIQKDGLMVGDPFIQYKLGPYRLFSGYSTNKRLSFLIWDVKVPQTIQITSKNHYYLFNIEKGEHLFYETEITYEEFEHHIDAFSFLINGTPINHQNQIKLNLIEIQ